jgi:hypothetical protein
MKQRKRSAKGRRKRGAGEQTRAGHSTQIVMSGVPGQELERAAADVGREAGKTLLRGLARVFGARFAGWLAENEAKAEARRIAIDTNASIDRARALTDERRRQELQEIEHEETMALAKRRLNRLVIEMAREQANVETIAARSLKQIEHDPDGDKPREVDDDWLFRFARYAQDVSDNDIQELWARILASAVTEGRQRVSAAALQSMSLMDNRAAKDFEKFCRAYATFGFYPAHDRVYQCESQAIGLRTLRELGLIEETNPLRHYQVAEFDLMLGALHGQLKLIHTRMEFTQRGSEIANALFREKQTLMPLDAELALKYWTDVISTQIDNNYSINIFPKIDGKQVAYVIQISKRTGARLPIAEMEPADDERFPDQLHRLIAWARENYLTSRAPNPYYQAAATSPQ